MYSSVSSSKTRNDDRLRYQIPGSNSLSIVNSPISEESISTGIESGAPSRPMLIVAFTSSSLSKYSGFEKVHFATTVVFSPRLTHSSEATPVFDNT